MSAPTKAPVLCGCGCGQPAPLAKRTDPGRGTVQGEPLRFISGHNATLASRARVARPAVEKPTPPVRPLPVLPPPRPTDTTVTGHEVADRMLPAAQQLVDAVRRGDKRAAHDAVAQARAVSYGHPYWVFTLLCTVAAMVPDDQSTSQLLAWIDAPSDDSTEMRIPA
jgi:hypothetical protein